jgi:hypothetical protein
VAERARQFAHLVARFVTSLLPREPKPHDVDLVRATLTPPEFEVWTRLARADRVESLTTLHRLAEPVAVDSRWAAAALLHDAGKSAAGLGPFGRAFATLRGAVGDAETVGGRAGAYLRHAEIGAEALEAVCARAEVVAWAATHHDPARWPTDLIPTAVCEALARADGERPGTQPKVKDVR